MALCIDFLMFLQNIYLNLNVLEYELNKFCNIRKQHYDHEVLNHNC